MSAVYRAHDPNLRRAVAVKLIHSHLSNDQEFVRRFESEAAAVAQLRHPNIVQVYDFDHDADVYYMVMEFVPGQTLQERLKELNGEGQRLPLAEAAGLMALVAEAVSYAHARGMIHRDLKPANVMLMAQDQPVLTDFGVAKILGSQQHTATGAVIGTPMYMSPEQVQGLPQDARTDIYSMGIMMYEMATGRPPYEGDSAITIMLKHVNEPLPDMRQRAGDVPQALKEVVDRALSKLPEGRFQTAAELAAALRLIAQRPNLPQHQPTVPIGPVDNPPTQMPADKTSLMSDAMIEQTSPRPAAPPPAPRPARPPEPRPAHRPAHRPDLQQGTIIVNPPPRPAPEPLAPIPAARRSPPWAILLGVSAVLVLCLVVGTALALFGPRLMAAFGGTATAAATEAQATATTELVRETPAPATDDVPPTKAPTDAPTLEPTLEPTLVPTDIPVPEGMVLVPGGAFAMGAGAGDSAPIHPVTLDPYYLDILEVTNQRYQACVGTGACSAPLGSSSFTRSGYFTNPAFANYPVVNVNWNQANAFCAAQGMRLPTEAEWEFAAGSGRSLPYPWGETFDAARLPVAQGDTVAGGSFPNGANEFGNFDLAGNVLEWVADFYSSTFYAESPEANPTGPGSGNEHVLRGGSFGNPDATAYLSTRRFRRTPGASDVDIGFRCAQTAP